MGLGFLISWLLIYYSHSDHRYIHPVLAIWCVSLPVFDLFSVVMRRMILRTSPFNPDRTHIHHLLSKVNISTNLVLIILSLYAVFYSLFGGLIFFVFGPMPALLTFIICFVIHTSISFYLTNIQNNK